MNPSFDKISPEAEDILQATETRLQKAELKIEEAKKRGGQEAIVKILEDYLDKVMDIRRQYPLEHGDIDLFSSNVGNLKDVPEKIRQELTKIHIKMQMVIEEVASRIEEGKYKSCEDFIRTKESELGKNELLRMDKLIKADKMVGISCQSLKLAVEFFNKINQEIVRRLEAVEKTGDSIKERNLALANAIMVYETTSFVINFLEKFKIEGEQEILALRDEIMKEINEARIQERELEEQISQVELQGIRQQIRYRMEALDTIEQTWDGYLKEIEKQKGEIDSLKPTFVKKLEFLRKNAGNQIRVISIIPILQIVQSSMKELGETVAIIEEMKLIPLNPERVKNLLNF